MATLLHIVLFIVVLAAFLVALWDAWRTRALLPLALALLALYFLIQAVVAL